jgi:hypothetical protein
MPENKLTVKYGEGKRIRCTFYDEDDVLADMSGYNFAAGIKENHEDTSYLLSKTDSNFDKTDVSSGYAYFTLTRTENKALGVGKFIIDAKAFDPADEDNETEKSVTYILEITKAVVD